jgi:hypothetical protein
MASETRVNVRVPPELKRRAKARAALRARLWPMWSASCWKPGWKRTDSPESNETARLAVQDEAASRFWPPQICDQDRVLLETLRLCACPAARRGAGQVCASALRLFQYSSRSG